MEVWSVQPGWQQCLSSAGLIWPSSMILHRHTDKWGGNLCSLSQLIIQPCKNQPAKSDAQASSNTQELFYISGATTWTRNDAMRMMMMMPSRTPVPGAAGGDSRGGSGHWGSRGSSPGEFRAGRGACNTRLDARSPAFWMKAFLKFIQFSSRLYLNDENIRIRQNTADSLYGSSAM